MPNYKLKYFDARGRAELCRLLFALADQDYEDVRYTRETWPAHKGETPFGQVPVLEVDGQAFSQSVAIAVYLAREFGFYGKTNLDALKIDQVLLLVVDFVGAAVKAFHAPEDQKAEAQKNFAETEVPKYVGFFEKLLKESKSGFFVGDTLTVADLAVYDFLYSMTSRTPALAEKIPAAVKALTDKVANVDKIKAYVANRKQTEF